MGEWVEVGATGQRGYLAMPEGDSAPGVLVLHAWWGLTPVFTDICDQLAAAGYVALAPSLFPNGETAVTIAEAEALLNAHDEEATAGPAVRAAIAQLRGLPGVAEGSLGIIGFSMGAYWALRLSRELPGEVGAVVVFYGTDDGQYETARAAYLGHFAEHDDYEPLAGVRALEERIRGAGREVAFYVYPGAHHWFVEPNRPEYDAAAELAWQRTLAFLRAHLR